MMKKVFWVLCLLIPLANGQSKKEGGDDPFAKMKPTVGELIPDVIAYDLEGLKFPLRKTKGSITVIVSGCFT
jgi:hypothetical protein